MKRVVALKATEEGAGDEGTSKERGDSGLTKAGQLGDPEKMGAATFLPLASLHPPLRPKLSLSPSLSLSTCCIL